MCLALATGLGLVALVLAAVGRTDLFPALAPVVAVVAGIVAAAFGGEPRRRSR
jgi:hypothetical protein